MENGEELAQIKQDDMDEMKGSNGPHTEVNMLTRKAEISQDGCDCLVSVHLRFRQ